MPPSVRVVGANESAERDRAAIERGISSRLLMQRAGEAAAHEMSRRYSERLRNGALIFTGPGNNGGDGWVVAETLTAASVDVTVIEAGEPTTPDAIAARAAAIAHVSTERPLPPARAFEGVVVDALLGTGAKGKARGKIAECIKGINELRSDTSPVVSLDVPSGLDATTGAHSLCVVADLTVSFGGVKRGTLLARDRCGAIAVVDIGLDEASDGGGAAEFDTDHLPLLVERDWVESRLPPIPYDAHKGKRKHLAIVGGGKGMPGAAVLAAKAAARSGIGMLRVLVDAENAGAVLAAVPSALISPWPVDSATLSGQISDWANAIVLGPGLGNSPATRNLVERVLDDSRLPVVLDADALNVFEDDTDALRKLLAGRPALLTPHAAELARLLGNTAKSVLERRFDVGSDFARDVNATVLLKGAPTIIFAPDGGRFVSARGSAALATGGSGDLLAGIAGTLLAQTEDPPTAAACAAWIHGRAAELCEYVRGTTLDDVLYALPRAWNEPVRPLDPPLLAVLPPVYQ